MLLIFLVNKPHRIICVFSTNIYEQPHQLNKNHPQEINYQHIF